MGNVKLVIHDVKSVRKVRLEELWSWHEEKGLFGKTHTLLHKPGRIGPPQLSTLY